MTQENLFKSIRRDFQDTEDALAVLAPHFETAVQDGRTIGDTFRHVTATVYAMPSRIQGLLATGELPFPVDAENAVAEGIAKFASLNPKLLGSELDAGHATLWAYIKQFSDEDLARTFTISGKEQTLGEVVKDLGQHEAKHVDEVLATAGMRLKVAELPHIGGGFDDGFTLRPKRGTGSHRHPDFEMLEYVGDLRRRHFATLVYISGEWWLDLDGRSLTAYPTREEAWEAARRDCARRACEYCPMTGYRRPRSDGTPPRPYWMCPDCWTDKERRRDTLRRRAHSARFLRGSRWKTRETAIVAAQAKIRTAIEAAEAAEEQLVPGEYFGPAWPEDEQNMKAVEHLELALPHIKAATLPNPPDLWEE